MMRGVSKTTGGCLRKGGEAYERFRNLEFGFGIPHDYRNDTCKYQ